VCGCSEPCLTLFNINVITKLNPASSAVVLRDLNPPFLDNKGSRKEMQGVNSACFIYYAGIKIFSNLPSDLKILMNGKAQFKIGLKRYSNTHSFYSVDEYLLSKR
jgi:hypothetical protein